MASSAVADSVAALGVSEDSVFSHDAVPTAADQVEELEKLGAGDPGRVTKNLFLKDNRNRFFLCTALHTTAVPFEKELGIRLGLKKNELRMASAESMQEVLRLEPGCVNPLAACLPSASRVILLLDENLKDAPFFIHPMVNTKSVRVSAEQLEKYLTGHGRQAHWVDLAQKKLKALKPQDLKGIADTVEEIKVKGEAKSQEKGTDSKKEKKAAKSGGGSAGKLNEAAKGTSSAAIVEELLLVVQGAVQSALEQQSPLTGAQESQVKKDVELFVNSLQNSAYAEGLSSGTHTAAAKILGKWR